MSLVLPLSLQGYPHPERVSWESHTYCPLPSGSAGEVTSAGPRGPASVHGYESQGFLCSL